MNLYIDQHDMKKITHLSTLSLVTRQCPRYSQVHGVFFQVASGVQGSQHTLAQGKVIFQCSEKTQGSVKA